MPTKKRIDSIDFWRGLVLVCIFIDHIPGNILENVTLRNIGFSDSAEAFVFLSGFSVVLAYARRLQTEGASAGSMPIFKRAFKIYCVHLLLTFLGIALVFVAFTIAQTHVVEPDLARHAVIHAPVQTLPGIFALTTQVGYFNILPMYVVLLLTAPVYILVGIKSRWKMLAGSIAIYAVARIFNINLPSWPVPGSWFFDPFCWQLMFAFGMAVGLTVRAEPIPYNRLVFWICVMYSVSAALINTSVFGWVPGLVDQAGQYLDWDKSTLGVARIIDFLAHAYVVCQLPIARLLKPTLVYAPMTLLGRHSLFVFSALTLMSILGQILKVTWIDNAAFDIVFVLVGVVGLVWIVRRLEWQNLSPAPNSGPSPASR
jgi:hypothetical protein